jgi:hypothetical protein
MAYWVPVHASPLNIDFKGDDNLNSGSSLEVFLSYELNSNHIGTESSSFEELGTDWNALPFIKCRTRSVRLM